MRVIRRYSVNGHYLHQTVEGIGSDLEVKEYGWGEHEGKQGPYGVVLYPYGYEALPKVLLVIYIDERWLPVKEDEEPCQACGNSVQLSDLVGGVCNTCRRNRHVNNQKL